MKKKFISVLLCFVITLYSFMPYGLVVSIHAQEATPIPTEEATPSSEPSSSPSVEPSSSSSSEVIASIIPTSTPSSDPTATPVDDTQSVSSPTPTPAPTIPPRGTPEYDAWKAERDRQKELLDQQRKADRAAKDERENEWEVHEDDTTWITAHGGSRSYYVSGAWQKDEDARIAAQKAVDDAAAAEAAKKAQAEQAIAAAAAASQNSDPSAAVLATSTDTLTNSSNPCSGPATGSTDSLAASVSNSNIGVDNANCLALDGTTNASGTSGINTVSGNDGSVDATTGSSGANGTQVNNGNVNTTVTSGSGESLTAVNNGDSLTQGATVENLSAGTDPTNLAQGTNSETLGVNNSNEAYVNNQLNVDGTSGQDIVADNDGNATLTTGDIELIANMLNILNINITGEDFMHLIVNIFGKLNGDLDLESISTALGLKSDQELQVIANNQPSGEDSTSTSNSSNTQTTDINNQNNAAVNNDMNVDGVSGQNNVSGNDGNATVITGRIKILANLMNFINANFSGEKWSFIMVNIFGQLTGNVIVPGTDKYLNGNEGGAIAENTSLGEGSTNAQSTTSNNTTSVTNTNGVQLTNDINANGLSGDNSLAGNDDGQTTQTGSVDVVTKLMNFLNFNVTGNNWVFLVVNVFGKWMGKIVGLGATDMNAPTDGSFAALSTGGSTGDATSSNTQSTDVTNNNLAVVNNDLDINGISGQSTVNNNDGTANLKTGWVEINANLLNIINMNVTGRSWMIVFLNVFGDFMGNLFFGKSPEPVVQTANQTATTETVNFSMGDSSTTAQQESSASNNSLVSTVLGVQTTLAKKKVKRIIPRTLVKNSVYYSNVQASPVDNGLYFSLFGKKIRIPDMFVEFFSRLALKGDLLLAHN